MPTTTTPPETPSAPPEPTEVSVLGAAEPEALKLLADLPIPEGSVELASGLGLEVAGAPSGLELPADWSACTPQADEYRIWHVSREPDTVIASLASAMETNPPATVKWSAAGEGGKAAGASSWWRAYAFVPTEPEAIRSEQLEFKAVAAEGGTDLRTDAMVVPAQGKCMSAE